VSFSNITPTALYERIRNGEPVDIIDVRSPREYEAAHAAGARLVPLDTLGKDMVLTGRPVAADEPVYVICWSGVRSSAACARLTGQGLDNVVNVEGGTQAWQKAGLPVEGSGVGSAARWFRLGGLLAVAGSLILGITVNSAFMFAAAGIWLALVVTGNAPCCSSGACSTGRGR
jgi:rhodanese-related sulfurtransferase